MPFNSGTQNTAVGNGALYSNILGSYNTAVGYLALGHNSTSLYNTSLGYAAGYNYDNGYNNVFPGAQTDVKGGGYYNVVARYNMHSKQPGALVRNSVFLNVTPGIKN